MYLEVIQYLESVKGLENDAKKFLLMARDSNQYQFTYAFAKQFMRRIIAKKGNNEILKNFELCKKNLKVNNNIPDRVIENQLEFENKLKEEFFDGIISDLLEFSRFETAKIVYGERMKEKIEFSQKTKLLGMKTFASMQMQPQFEEIFNEIVLKETNLDEAVIENIASSVSLFNSEFGKENVAQNTFMEQLYKKSRKQKTVVSEIVFDQQALAAAEKQHWSKLEKMLQESTFADTKSSRKTINKLKQALVYCFDADQRNKVKRELSEFEYRLFPDYKQRAKQEAIKPSSVSEANEIVA